MTAAPGDGRVSSTWEVLGRRTPDDPWTAVGAVHAPDAGMALLLAKESFFRHGEGVDFAVVRTEDVHRWPNPDWLEFATDKDYKLQRGYTGLGGKRRRAAARAEELDAVIDRPRPADRRVLNADHRAGATPPGDHRSGATPTAATPTGDHRAGAAEDAS